MVSEQVPPFKHGFDSQRLLLVWHKSPTNPGSQRHLNPDVELSLMHVPCTHGFDVQSIAGPGKQPLGPIPLPI